MAEHQDIPHDNEGHTKAAWTTVIIVMLGFLVGCIAFLIPSVPLFWVGVCIVVLGAVVGKVMQMMGLGQVRPQGMVPSETIEIERVRNRARTENN